MSSVEKGAIAGMCVGAMTACISVFLNSGNMEEELFRASVFSLGVAIAAGSVTFFMGVVIQKGVHNVMRPKIEAKASRGVWAFAIFMAVVSAPFAFGLSAPEFVKSLGPKYPGEAWTDRR